MLFPFSLYPVNMLYLKFVTTAKKGASQMPHTGGGTFLSFNREISL
jgi:hypothetical protein